MLGSFKLAKENGAPQIEAISGLTRGQFLKGTVGVAAAISVVPGSALFSSTARAQSDPVDEGLSDEQIWKVMSTDSTKRVCYCKTVTSPPLTLERLRYNEYRQLGADIGLQG